MDNPFQATSRSHRLFEVLANADRPLRADEIAAGVGEEGPDVAHSVLRDIRAKGITVYRYRDPTGTRPTASVYSLRPVEGLTELAGPAQQRGRRAATRPPTPVPVEVRQPHVGSVARVTALVLEDDQLRARFECDGTVYAGTLSAAQPAVGEWLTLVTVGLHGRGLYVDLAGARVVTVEDIEEVK